MVRINLEEGKDRVTQSFILVVVLPPFREQVQYCLNYSFSSHEELLDIRSELRYCYGVNCIYPQPEFIG